MTEKTVPVVTRRVYVDLPESAAHALKVKAAEMQMTSKALMEKLVLDFVNAKPKKGKK